MSLGFDSLSPDKQRRGENMPGAQVKITVYKDEAKEKPRPEDEKPILEEWITFPKECLAMDMVALAEVAKAKIISALGKCTWELEEE